MQENELKFRLQNGGQFVAFCLGLNVVTPPMIPIVALASEKLTHWPLGDLNEIFDK